MAYTCTKTFDCVSTAHRNWRAKNNTNRDSVKCSYIHGYTKTFTFVFGCESLDEYNWVYDYGTTSSGEERTMTKIKKFIQDELDHGVTTDSEDPLLAKLYEMHELELIKLVVIPVENGQSGSVEGLCRYLYNRFDPQLRKESNGRVWIESVTVSEHHKNSSTYTKENKVEQTIDINHKDLYMNGINDELNKYFEDTKKIKDNDSKNDTPFDIFNSEEFKKISETLMPGLDTLLKSFPKKTVEETKSPNDILNKVLTKDNLMQGLRLLQAHPKYSLLATSLLLLDESKIKEFISKNKEIMDIIKKVK